MRFPSYLTGIRYLSLHDIWRVTFPSDQLSELDKNAFWTVMT